MSPSNNEIIEKIEVTKPDNKVSKYLNDNKLWNDGQNGFRKGRSTIGTVAEFTDDVLLGINNKNFTLAAFVDLRKAFNKV